MVIAGRFRLDRKLGEGAMGCVYAGWHVNLGVPVAVKFIVSEHAGRSDVVSRFAQEAMAAARIDSPHVVRILDYGFDEQNRPYLAMEMLRGEVLADRLERERVLPVDVTSHVLRQAAKGLARAHAAGIVHRDIKPDNMFLCEDDEEAGFVLKILDFGIAKAGAMSGFAHKTATGAIMGTPLYMSPEQAMGNKQLDTRTDLYSLGVVAFRCLSGEVPFNSDGLGALIVSILHQPHPALSSIRPDLGTAFDGWFARALAKDPAARFQSAKEMAEAFAAVAAGVSAAAPPRNEPAASAVMSHHSDPEASVAIGLPGTANQAITLEGAASTHHAPRVGRSRTGLAAAAIGTASLALVAGVVAWVSLRADSVTSRPTPSATTTEPPSEPVSAPAASPVPSSVGAPPDAPAVASSAPSPASAPPRTSPTHGATTSPRANASAPPAPTPTVTPKPPPPKEDKYAL